MNKESECKMNISSKQTEFLDGYYDGISEDIRKMTLKELEQAIAEEKLRLCHNR